MSRSLRRYEILLPLRFNDGQSVPDELVADALLELEQRFGAVSTRWNFPWVGFSQSVACS